MERNEQEILFFGMLLEDIIESDDESDDEFTLTEVMNLIKKSVIPRVPRIRCKNYIEKVVWKYTNDEFKSHFR